MRKKPSSKSFYQRRSFSLPRASKIDQNIIERFDQLLEFASPERYRDTLIQIYHSYISDQHEYLPLNFREMSQEMSLLIELFKDVEKER